MHVILDKCTAIRHRTIQRHVTIRVLALPVGRIRSECSTLNDTLLSVDVSELIRKAGLGGPLQSPAKPIPNHNVGRPRQHVFPNALMS